MLTFLGESEFVYGVIRSGSYFAVHSDHLKSGLMDLPVFFFCILYSPHSLACEYTL